jgi:molybdopterin-containing oxidoreductase family membrane subunit
MFSPTFVDIGIFIGTIGFFFVLFLLYARTFPVIAQAEVKSILKSSGERYKKLRDAGKPLYEIKSGSIGSLKATPTPSSIEETPTVIDEPKIEDTAQDQEGSVSDLLDSLGTFDPTRDTADDLKRVKGIGPKMEKTLNQIGIFTFAQVSKMTEKEYNLLDSITGSFPGRAQRDDWAGQARNLNNNN